jgi:hypothetical protein
MLYNACLIHSGPNGFEWWKFLIKLSGPGPKGPAPRETCAVKGISHIKFSCVCKVKWAGPKGTACSEKCAVKVILRFLVLVF